MLKKVRLEGKNKEDLLKKFLEENNLNLNDIYLKEEKIEAKLFKSKKIVLEIVTREDIKNYIKEYINDLSYYMNLEINSEIRENSGVYNIILISNNNNVLIGKDGRTLNSIQLLLHQALNNQTGLNIKMNVDVSNYKEKRIKRLEHEITQVMNEVENTKIEAKLDPMNSYERRFIHTLVAENKNLESESFGETPNRYVVIRCKNH